MKALDPFLNLSFALSLALPAHTNSIKCDASWTKRTVELKETITEVNGHLGELGLAPLQLASIAELPQETQHQWAQKASALKQVLGNQKAKIARHIAENGQKQFNTLIRGANLAISYRDLYYRKAQLELENLEANLDVEQKAKLGKFKDGDDIRWVSLINSAEGSIPMSEDLKTSALVVATIDNVLTHMRTKFAYPEETDSQAMTAIYTEGIGKISGQVTQADISRLQAVVGKLQTTLLAIAGCL